MGLQSEYVTIPRVTIITTSCTILMLDVANTKKIVSLPTAFLGLVSELSSSRGQVFVREGEFVSGHPAERPLIRSSPPRFIRRNK